MALDHAEASPLQGTVCDLLTAKGSRLFSISPRATVYEAAAMLEQHRVGALLVMDEERLVGIISERDCVRKVILGGNASRETLVEDIMTADVIAVSPELALGQCLKLVTERRIRHLPVVSRGKVAGVLSIGDLVRAVVAQQAGTIKSLKLYIDSDYPT
jgi:CBS domain-containing protein